MPRESTWPSNRLHLLPTAMIFADIHHPTQHLSWWDSRGYDPPFMNARFCSKFIRFFNSSLRLVAWPLCNTFRSSMSRQVKPLNFRCPEEASSPSFRTQVGRRCPLICCFDLSPGLHFTHNPFCSGLVATSSELWDTLPPRFLSGPTLGPCPTMPRLRHRLRCRRGSVRASSARRWRSHSDSSASSSSAASYEHSREGRHSSPAHRRRSLASLRPRSGSSRPPADSRPAAPLHNPSTAIFHYQSSANKPLIIATITVSFKEVAETIPAPPPSSHLINEPASSPYLHSTLPAGFVDARKGGEGCSTNPQAEGSHAGVQDAEPTAIPSNTAHIDESAGWCRIEEEQPSGDYGL